MYWVTAVYQTLRDTDIYYSIHRHRTPAVCPALEVLKCIIHSFTHLFTIHVLSTCCVPGSWGPNIHYSFIHPFTLHTLTAYCLLSTWLCPGLGEATWQPESLTSWNFHLHFLNRSPIITLDPHSGLWKDVIFMTTLWISTLRADGAEWFVQDQQSQNWSRDV